MTEFHKLANTLTAIVCIIVWGITAQTRANEKSTPPVNKEAGTKGAYELGAQLPVYGPRAELPESQNNPFSGKPKATALTSFRNKTQTPSARR